MPTISDIQHLVKNISALSNSLPKSISNGTTKDKLYTVMHTQEGDTVFETFNKRFVALFGQDCRNTDGRLHHIRQGRNGMGLVCAYLNKVDWSSDIPLDLVEIKLQRLSEELGCLRGTGANEPHLPTDHNLRHVNPTSDLAGIDNIEQSQLSFQRKSRRRLLYTQENLLLKPRPRPSQAGARPKPSVKAWPNLSESQSRLRPGQSHGFQAKPGRNSTTCWTSKLPLPPDFSTDLACSNQHSLR